MKGRVLIIAGSDSGGGAGVQADIKTVTALGGYAATAITALTVQDTQKVHHVEAVGPDLIREQISVVLDDIGADAIKIGMIGSVTAGAAIIEALEPYPDIPLIVDPVLVATSGDSLGGSNVGQILKHQLFPMAALITPNVPEAGLLTDKTIKSEADLQQAAEELLKTGANAVLAKGGHLPGVQTSNLLTTDKGTTKVTLDHIDSPHTHGTGCTLASAMATFIAQGIEMEEALRRASLYVHAAIKHAPGLGGGHGPLNHALRPVAEDGHIVSYRPAD